jgi:hypothetical protein
LHTVRRDIDGAPAVVLNDLVAGAFGTTASDGGSTRCLTDGNSIFAYILEPDVLDRARALAVNTLGLISADNNIPESYTVISNGPYGGSRRIYLRVAPFSSRNTASLSPPSFWPEQAPLPRS